MNDDLSASIAALWRDAQPRTLTRVETLEAAVAALLGDALDADLADSARREAHRLAGMLGTFGMPAGTEHARAVERRLEDGAAPPDAPALAEHVTALRRIVEDGPAPRATGSRSTGGSPRP